MALLERHTDLVRKIVVREVAKNTRRGGRAHKMWLGQMISPKNGGSVDTIVNFWGECNSNVIFMLGVHIKLVHFRWSVFQFHENLGGVKTFHQKSSRMGGGRYFKKMGEVDTFPNKWGI